MTGFDTITYEVVDGVGRLTLDRPDHRNGMTNQMVRESHEALQLAAADRSLRVLVLTGSGSSFCPGADLGHFTDGGAETGEGLHPSSLRVATLLHEIPAVTVAAINGACAGAGFGWALACDLRVVAASARMNVAFLTVGVAGDMGIPWTLGRIVGATKIRELVLLPEKITAEQALDLGIVARVFPDESFRDDAEGFVQRLMATSPTALWAVKANILASEKLGFADYVDVEAERHLRVAASEDTAEGFRAFIEKRPPRWAR